MSIEEEYQYVLSLPIDKQRIYLKDDEFRKRLFSSEGHYPFVWLVQDLKDEQLSYLLDDNLITLLKNDSRLVDKLNAIMTCGNSCNNEFLKRKEIVEMIINNISKLRFFIDNLNIVFGSCYFKYIIDEGRVDYLKYLNDSVLLEILSVRKNLELIKKYKLDYTFFDGLEKSVIEYLLNDSYFENIFLNSPIDFITHIIKTGVKLPAKLHYSNTLINKYLEIDDPIIFTEYLMDLEKENVYLKDIIKTKRQKEDKEKVENIDKNLGIFKEYIKYLDSNNKQSLELGDTYEKRLNNLQLSTSNKLLNMIIGMNYEELPYNFIKNLQNMIRYVEVNDENIIPSYRLEIYKGLMAFHKLSLEDKINLFYEISNNSNAIGEFYDDYKACYNSSLIKLKAECLNVDSLTKSSLSDKYGINVYELKGEKFKMLINHTKSSRSESNLNFIWGSQQEVASLSLIGDKCLTTFRNPKENIILGFNEFDYRNIMHIYHSDSMSSHEFSSKRVIDLLNPDDLIDSTINYNEILMKYSDKLKPSYVVCYDDIKVGDIDVSKKLGNIPIVLIHTDKYEQQISMIDFNDDDYMSYFDYRTMQNSKKGR